MWLGMAIAGGIAHCAIQMLLEILLDFCGEILFQLLVQLIGESAEHAVAPYRRGGARSGPLSFLVHVVAGGGLGALSLLVWPHSLIDGSALRVANLVAAPLIAGLFTTAIGRVRRRAGKPVVALEFFTFGFGFAFSFALVRFLATS